MSGILKAILKEERKIIIIISGWFMITQARYYTGSLGYMLTLKLLTLFIIIYIVVYKSGVRFDQSKGVIQSATVKGGYFGLCFFVLV